MTEQSDRFLQRKNRSVPRITLVPAAEQITALRSSPLEDSRADAMLQDMSEARSIDTTPAVPDEAEVSALLTEIRSKFDRSRFDRFLSDMRDSTLNAVAGPLGLGYVVSGLKAFDDGRPGGTAPHYQHGTKGISTVIVLSAPGRHEEAAGRPAAGSTGEELQALVATGHAKRPDIFPSPDLRDYRVTNAWDKIEYPGKTGRPEATLGEVLSEANLRRLHREVGGAEYIVSCGDNAIAAIGALKLPAAQMQGHHPSLKTMNTQQKSDKATPSERREHRREQWINQTLESSNRPPPTIIERAAAQATFILESGYKMGQQQMIGAVLLEFSVAMSNEIVGCFRHGIRETDEHLLAAIGRRASYVGHQVLRKWKSILEAGVFGLVSGIVTEIAVIFVKMLQGISARLIRIIRQGIVSILRAVKMVLFPPPGADPAEIWHEASKLLAAGMIVSGGVILEELVTKMLPGFDLISTVVVSLLTGLGTAVVMYLLDKLDLFSAGAGQHQKMLFAELDARLGQAMHVAAEASKVFAAPTLMLAHSGEPAVG